MSMATLDLVIVLPIAIVFGVFICYRRFTRHDSIQEEAETWLRGRERNRYGSIPCPRKKWRAVLLWMPCLAVSLFATCITEVIGMTSRLFYSPLPNISGKHFIIPEIWIIDHQENSHLSAMTVPGIARIGIKRYWDDAVPLSQIVFIDVAHPEEQLAPNVFLQGETILAKRSFRFGSETLNCWDLIHNNPYVGPSPKDPFIADISCTTESNHFYAHFNGWRGDSDAFYKALHSVTFR